MPCSLGRLCWLTAVLCALSTLPAPASADDWPQWRGPRRDAVSLETGLLPAWPDGGPGIAWRASSLGTGYASVAISRETVYTIGQHESDLYATALREADGQPVWSRRIGETARNSCSTPTVDGDRLYVLDPDGELLCLDANSGEALWQRSFVDDFGGRMMSGRGYGESPLVDGERLICSPGGPEAGIVALDKLTGEVLWKAAIPELGGAGRDGMGFSSIVVSEAAGVRQYVQLTGRGLVGIAADDGRWLWGYNDICNDTANIPTPIVRGDLVFSANGYNAGSVLLRITAEGGGDPRAANWRADVVYRLKGHQFQNHHGGVALIGDHVYGGHGSNNGLPTCLELASGQVLWKQRGPGVGSAAVIAADGRFYFRYQNGLVALIEADAGGFDVRGTLQIPGAGGDSWSHPAIANGRLYLREQDVLWVHDVRAHSSSSPGAGRSIQVESLPAPLAVLHEAGANVERLSDRSPPLYRYAREAEAEAATQSPFLIGLDNRHLTADGGIAPELLAQLQGVREPIILDFAGTRVSEAGLAQLETLPHLVGLSLELCGRMTDDSLARLQPLSRLRVLVLAGTGIGAEGIGQIAALTNLAAIDLEVCDAVTDAACERLGSFARLRALVLKKTGFERTRITDAGLEQLCRLSELELLNLYGNSVTDAGLVHLQRLASLRRLDLSLLPITDAGIVHLQPLQNLEQLDLLFSVGFAGPMLTDSAAESLQSLSRLSMLNLTGTRLTDAGLVRLQSLNGLRSLHVARTPVTDAGVRAFQAAVPACRVTTSAAAVGDKK